MCPFNSFLHYPSISVYDLMIDPDIICHTDFFGPKTGDTEKVYEFNY